MTPTDTADPLVTALTRLGHALVDAMELRRPLFDDEIAALDALSATVETELASYGSADA